MMDRRDRRHAALAAPAAQGRPAQLLNRPEQIPDGNRIFRLIQIVRATKNLNPLGAFMRLPSISGHSSRLKCKCQAAWLSPSDLKFRVALLAHFTIAIGDQELLATKAPLRRHGGETPAS